MDIGSKEHYDLMAQFERYFKYHIEREDKQDWARGIVYQNGHTNELFLAFRMGYSFRKAVEGT